MSPELHDTYVAALQHELVDLPSEIVLLGVVRKPTPWLYGVVDENEAALGPPTSLLEGVKDRQSELEEAGHSDVEAHNLAMEELSYDNRYLEYIDSSPDAKVAIEAIINRLKSGEEVALVCFENSEEKRCHRTLLREYIESRM